MKMKQSRRGEKQEISEVEEDGLGHTGFGNTLTSSSRHSSGLRFTAYRASKRAKENAIRILKTTWYHDAATDYNITAKIGYCSTPQFLRTLKVQ